MVEIKFVDIKHLNSPRHLWDSHVFAMCKCGFNSTGFATVVCPAIRQILVSKGILYFFDDAQRDTVYVLTDCNKEKNGIKINFDKCTQRLG